jgi:hypothetical protein
MIVAVPAAAAIIWAIHRVVTHLLLVHEVIIGREATSYSEALPSMVERFHKVDDRFTDVQMHLRKQDKTTDTLVHELSMNGGGTLKDRLIRVERKVDDLHAGQDSAAQTARDVSSTALITAADVAKTAVDAAQVIHDDLHGTWPPK